MDIHQGGNDRARAAREYHQRRNNATTSSSHQPDDTFADTTNRRTNTLLDESIANQDEQNAPFWHTYMHPSPPSKNPTPLIPIPRNPSPTPSYLAMLNDKWIDAASAVCSGRFELALRQLKNLLSSCLTEGYEHPQVGLLRANIGILHWHLGEVHDARRYLLAAAETEGCREMAILKFLVGCVSFELGAWQDSWVAFRACLDLFRESEVVIDYDEGGFGMLGYVLRKEQVLFNLERAHGKCVYDDGSVLGIWRLPGMLIFEPFDENGRRVGCRFGGTLDV